MNKTGDKLTESAARADIQAGEPMMLPHATEASTMTRIIVGVLLFLIICAEVLTMFIGIIPGVILYSVLLLALVNLSYFSRNTTEHRLYLAFTLPALLRILSLAMPVQLVTLLYRYVMVGIPLWLATGMVIRSNGLPGLRHDLTNTEWISQILIGGIGIPLGIIASLILPQPPDVMSINNWYLILFQLVVLTLFGAVTEEIIFRGLIQKALIYPFGFLSIFITSILYATMFLGTHSIGFIIYYGMAGLLFSFLAQVSDSLWGVIAAHSLMNIVLLVIFYLH